MKLFACMCNQPQRLSAALAPVRATLVAQPPVSRWGLGYIQGGDVLLVRTPKSSTTPVDLAAPLAEIATDCAIAQAVDDDARTAAPTTRRRSDTGAGCSRRPARRISMRDRAAPARARPRVPAPQPQGPHARRARVPRVPLDAARRGQHRRSEPADRRHAPRARGDAPAGRRRSSRRLEIGDRAALGNVALTNGRSMVVARLDEPLRLRRLDGHQRRASERDRLVPRRAARVGWRWRSQAKASRTCRNSTRCWSAATSRSGSPTSSRRALPRRSSRIRPDSSVGTGRVRDVSQCQSGELKAVRPEH